MDQMECDAMGPILEPALEVYSERVQFSSSVMVWGDVSFKGAFNLVGVEGTLDPVFYCTFLNKSLLPMARDLYKDNWTFL